MKILYHIKKNNGTYVCIMDGRCEDGSHAEITLSEKEFIKYNKQENLINLKKQKS